MESPDWLQRLQVSRLCLGCRTYGDPALAPTRSLPERRAGR